MQRFIAILLVSFFIINVFSEDAKHPGTVKHVIIDTDCGIDDLWALSILLSRPEVHIKAIIVSEGCLSPDEGTKKVSALLHSFGADSIEIVKGSENKNINPQWRFFCSQVSWGPETIKREILSLDEYLPKIDPQQNLIMLCLGSLSSIYQIRTNSPVFYKTIKRVIWYSTSANPLKGFNYDSDSVAATKMIKEGNIRIDVVSNRYKTILFDTSTISLAKHGQGMLINEMNYIYNQPVLNKNLNHSGKTVADELVVLYLLAPELFTVNLKVTNPRLRWVEAYEEDLLKEMLVDIIKGEYTAERSIVYNEFPSKRSFYNYDVRRIMDTAIERYGRDEWKACVLTDEFHGHLGVFSIVGAKMGIKARELFNVGPDQLNVISFAGSRPPYSCMSDGIQVSTGSTLGQGLIKISTDTITKPSAIFTYKGRSVRITLKPDYLRIVDSDIATGIAKFGLTDDGYWKLVRQSALNYWLNWDRNKIFDIEWLKSDFAE